jgi:uncharacterized protein (TIGR03086 family)
MTDIAELHDRALESTGRVVAGIRADQWHNPTPCEGWDVRDLVNHLVSGNLWAAELAAGATIDEVGDRLDGDLLGSDPHTAFDASAKASSEVFHRSGALEAQCAVSYGPVPGSVYAGHRFIDVLVHGWDLATATGQDTTIEPALVDACLDVVEPQAGLLQASGMFGTGVDPSPEATPQTRLLSVLGRIG